MEYIVGELVVGAAIRHKLQGGGTVEFIFIGAAEAVTNDLVVEVLPLVVIKKCVRQDKLGVGRAIAVDIELHVFIIAVESPLIVIPLIVVVQPARFYGWITLAFVLAGPGV